MFGAETVCPSRALTTTLVARYRDGGHQERDAATRFVKKVFPSAEVNATQVNERPIRVKIALDGEEVVVVDQRDLFGKYGHPAEADITEALTKLKEERSL